MIQRTPLDFARFADPRCSLADFERYIVHTLAQKESGRCSMLGAYLLLALSETGHAARTQPQREQQVLAWIDSLLFHPPSVQQLLRKLELSKAAPSTVQKWTKTLSLALEWRLMEWGTHNFTEPAPLKLCPYMRLAPTTKTADILQTILSNRISASGKHRTSAEARSADYQAKEQRQTQVSPQTLQQWRADALARIAELKRPGLSRNERADGMAHLLLLLATGMLPQRLSSLQALTLGVVRAFPPGQEQVWKTFHHKTASTGAPLVMVFPPEVVDALHTAAAHFHATPTNLAAPLLPQARAGEMLTRLVKRKYQRYVTVNTFRRHAITSVGKGRDEQLMGHMARAQGHSRATQQRYYALNDSEDSAKAAWSAYQCASVGSGSVSSGSGSE